VVESKVELPDFPVERIISGILSELAKRSGAGDKPMCRPTVRVMENVVIEYDDIRRTLLEAAPIRLIAAKQGNMVFH